MDLDYATSEKIEDDVRAFISRSWGEIEGPNGSMANSKAVVVTARKDGGVAGAIKGWTAGGVGYAEEFIVSPELRGQGVGSKLLELFEKQCLANHAPRLALRARQGSREQELYERQGWKEEFVVDDWLGGHAYVQLRKDLKAS